MIYSSPLYRTIDLSTSKMLICGYILRVSTSKMNDHQSDVLYADIFCGFRQLRISVSVMITIQRTFGLRRPYTRGSISLNTLRVIVFFVYYNNYSISSFSLVRLPFLLKPKPLFLRYQNGPRVPLF